MGENKGAISVGGTLLITGAAFLEVTERGAKVCEEETNKIIPSMGKLAPVCYEVLGRLLAQADVIGCCFFGCPGKCAKDIRSNISALDRVVSAGSFAACENGVL